MIRGTTPTIVVEFTESDIQMDEVEQIWVTLKNLSNSKTYEINDFSIDTELKRAVIRLPQDDTLNFINGRVKIQLRVLLKNGFAFASRIEEVCLGDVLKEGEIL